MARSRNIKPGFFKNEELVELPYETRLLFIGLWTIADREGRLEDRPKRIKMELFPADSIDIDECLNQLQASGFVLRYAIAGARYIQVLAFTKHQNPHQKEAASTIPAPDSGQAQDEDALGEHDASPVQAPDGHDASPADSLNSDSLNSDSGFPHNARERATGADAPDRDVTRERFDSFWSVYPKRVGKGAAEKWWRKHKPSQALTDTMIGAVREQEKSDQWRRDGGQFIPNPSTWLNQERWRDDAPTAPKNITPFQNSNRKQDGWSSYDIAAYATELERQGQ